MITWGFRNWEEHYFHSDLFQLTEPKLSKLSRAQVMCCRVIQTVQCHFRFKMRENEAPRLGLIMQCNSMQVLRDQSQNARHLLIQDAGA